MQMGREKSERLEAAGSSQAEGKARAAGPL